MANRAPQNFTIQISLDENLDFQYNDLFSNHDASSLAVINGDRISWILDPAIPERMFQIDFGPINPFQIFHNVTFRGEGQVVTDPVSFPASYPGNRQLKYTVSLGNGLSDDPEVVPVESQAAFSGLIVLPKDFKVQWVDGTFQAITLNPPEVVKSAGGARVAVTWAWNVGATDPTPPFSLAFSSPPAGWPSTPINSTDIDPKITLVLPPGARTQFTISTVSGDGSTNITAQGYLTITA
jgi:hypothetical protein